VGERFAELEEQLQVVSREWADGPFSFDGRRYTVRDLDALPKPVQRPRPNLIVGGRGGRRSVALGARFADEYNTFYKAADQCAVIRRELDDACSREGREPVPLSLMAGWMVGEDRAELLDRAGRLAECRGHPDGAQGLLDTLDDSWIVGTLEEATEQLTALAAKGVERVMLQHLLHRDLDAVMQIGRQVAPAVA
jgi:alkanesulfonate monooxygenase SsuD/methylene tetrahydromethanopterin reductase-like flavin-dependent oxidoreductase (luciferase family)